jgi:hypothetical protein
MAGSSLLIRRASIILPAKNEALNSTPNTSPERSNFFIALGPSDAEQVSTACDGEEGLFQKPMLAGKPRDMQTETRPFGK